MSDLNRVYEHREETPEAGPPEIVVRGIMQGLYLGEYVPGQRLVEADLVREYTVSRGSVREALSRLSSNGIVLLSRHKGAQIRKLTPKEMFDLVTVLELLVGLAARLAALNSSAPMDRFSETVDVLLNMEKAYDSYEFVRARSNFYKALLDLGGNDELARILPSGQVHLLRSVSRTVSSRPRVFADYREIADAVIAGDADRAEKAGRTHMGHLKEDLRAAQSAG